MAYFIFLKYLRSLEEFSKNPHVKIPPKSPCANFQSLGIFKNLISIRKGFFFRFQPIRPSPARAGSLRPAGCRLPAQPTRPKPRWHICRKTNSLRLCALWQRRLPSLTSPPCGARLSAPSPSPRRPTVATSPRRLRPPRTAQLHPQMPPEPLLAPPSSPPLNPPLNLAPSSMALKPLTPPLLPPATPPRRSPGPYKRVMRPPALTAPHPLSPELLCALLRPRDELKPLPFAASGVPSRCHSSVTGEHLPSTASTGSSSPLRLR
jgi:hypothetical protein